MYQAVVFLDDNTRRLHDNLEGHSLIDNTVDDCDYPRTSQTEGYSMAKAVISEPDREIEVIDDVDVLVVGGGPAGVCAAVAAARAGARTFLVERHGFFGGMWTAGMVITLAGYNAWLRPYARCVDGVAGEWLRRAAAKDGAEDNDGWVLNSDPEVMKRVADALLEEAGVQCLFHTWGAMPIMKGRQVDGIFVENVDGRRAILARVTVDCTGNGDVMVRAGARWQKSDALQPMTMPFRIGNVEPDENVDHAATALIPVGPEPGLLKEPLLSQYASRRPDVVCDRDAMRAARERGELPTYGGPWFGGMEKRVAWVNTTRIFGDASVASEWTRAEIQGRKDVFRIMTYFKKHLPGFEEARLLQTSTQIGVRETRRLLGQYTLCGDDIRNATSFENGIAIGCWPIDIHPSDGEAGVHAMYIPLPYHIPYECLLPQEVNNLLVAGRCISADREALGSSRVGATCAAIGQAAGAAAAIAAQSKINPGDVDVHRLRELLIDQQAIVDSPLKAATVKG